MLKTRTAVVAAAAMASLGLGAATAAAQTGGPSPVVAVPTQVTPNGLFQNVILPSRPFVDNLLNIIYGLAGQSQPQSQPFSGR